MTQKKLFLLIAFLLTGVFLLACFFFRSSFFTYFSLSKSPAKKRPSLTLNNRRIFVEIAKTDTERRQGLSGHPPLTDDAGMLFIFDQPGNYGFWMKEMLFPLDFIFIDGDVVVDLVQNVPFPVSEEDPVTVRAKFPFDKVLEIKAGKGQEMGVEVGDKAVFDLP